MSAPRPYKTDPTYLGAEITSVCIIFRCKRNQVIVHMVRTSADKPQENAISCLLAEVKNFWTGMISLSVNLSLILIFL